MVTQRKFPLGFDFINFVVEHLTIAVKPKSEHKAWNRRKLHDFNVKQSKFVTEFRRDSVEICQR